MQNFRWFGVRKLIRTESPLYRFTKDSLAADEHYIRDLDSGQYRKYAPYNYIQVVNSTDKDLVVDLESAMFSVPSGTIRSVDEESVKAFRSFDIYTSNGAATTSGKIEVLVQKVVSQRMILREIAQKRGIL